MPWIFQVPNREVFLTQEIKGALLQPTGFTHEVSTYKFQQNKKSKLSIIAQIEEIEKPQQPFANTVVEEQSFDIPHLLLCQTAKVSHIIRIEHTPGLMDLF